MTAGHVRIFRTVLIGAYAVIPLALASGTYEGWLFQSSTPNTNIAVGVLVALVAATMVAEYAGVFERAATGRDFLKAIAYWLGAFVWVVAVVRRVPDDSTGGAVLVGPLSALMLGGVFHLSRFGAMCTRSLTGALMTAMPLPVAPPISGSSSAQGMPAAIGTPAEPDRVDIAANTGKIALRLLGGIAVFLILAQVARGTAYGGFGTGVFYVGAIVLGVMALRSLPNRGPAVSLASDGISIRRDLCAIRHLPWHEVIGFEMKSAMANTFLVIHLTDANALIAQRGPISRFFMDQSQAMFGSPVRIPVSWLKCEPNWLWQKANEMILTSKSPTSSRISH